jgi:uncharacterized membrane protein
MDDVVIARALHVLAVVHWIGGVALVTLVVLPAVRAAAPSRRMELFETFERRFSAQARVSVPLAGLTGAWMADRLGLWGRFLDHPAAWWLGAMVLVWLMFMAILFVIEPFLIRDSFRRRVLADSDRAFRLVQRAHWVLLAAGLIAVVGGVAGVHG